MWYLLISAGKRPPGSVWLVYRLVCGLCYVPALFFFVVFFGVGLVDVVDVVYGVFAVCCDGAGIGVYDGYDPGLFEFAFCYAIVADVETGSVFVTDVKGVVAVPPLGVHFHHFDIVEGFFAVFPYFKYLSALGFYCLHCFFSVRSLVYRLSFYLIYYALSTM